MKRFITAIIIVLVSSLSLRSQEIGNLDFISPFHENLAAIKKGDLWGFIDNKGTLVINFRDDLVPIPMNGSNYPLFNSGRCLIQKDIDGIAYFGYINYQGESVMEPQYLNATQFNNGLAVVLKLYRNILGQNDVLDKSMIAYNYMELVINPDGEIVHYITEDPIHITLSKDFMDGPPEITSKILSKQVIAIKDEENKWSLKKV
jgi:hypothetical protein